MDTLGHDSHLDHNGCELFLYNKCLVVAVMIASIDVNQHLSDEVLNSSCG